jgi:tetratricopeptide (TPR) repeat protein
MKTIKLSVLSLISLISLGLGAQSLDEAKRLSSNEQFEDAEKVFQELITSKPKEANFYYFAGLNLMAKGDSLGAIKMFDEGLFKSPKCKINNVGKGYIALRQGKYTEAELFFTQALTEKSKLLPLINKEIGRAYLLVEWASPKQIIDNAIKAEKYLTPVAEEDWEAKLLLGDAFMMSKGNDLSFAVTQYITAGNELPNDPRPLLKEAIVYRRVQNYELSKIRIEESLLKEKEYAPAYRQLAEVFGLLKDKDSSIYFYKEYLKRNNNLSARRRFVEMLYLNGQFDEAISEGKDLLAVYEFSNIYGVIAYAYVGKKTINAEEVTDALVNFTKYEDKYLPSQNRSASARESYNKAFLIFKKGETLKADSLLDYKSLIESLKSSTLKSDSLKILSIEMNIAKIKGDKDIEFTKSYNLYYSVLSDTSKCQDNWYDGAREQLFTGSKYDYAKNIIVLKQKKKQGKLDKKDLFYLGRCYSRLKQNKDEVAVNFALIAQDANYFTGYFSLAKAATQLDKSDTVGLANYFYVKSTNLINLDTNQRIAHKSSIESACNNADGIASYIYLKCINMMDSTQKVKYKDDIETAYRNLAFSSLKMKKFELAISYYDKVLLMSPADQDIIDIRAKYVDYLAKLKAREAKLKAAPTKK